MHRLFAVLLGALALSVLVVGCAAGGPGSPPSSPTPSSAAPIATAPMVAASVTPAASVDASYPAPEAEPTVALPSYPSPQDALPGAAAASPKGTPITGKGHVQGVVINRGAGNAAEPLGNRMLYLAQMLLNTDGTPSGIVRVDENSAPMAVTDGAGHFVFENIDPGYYALAIKMPRDLLLAHDVKSGEDVLLEVKAGEVVDTGEIVISIGG